MAAISGKIAAVLTTSSRDTARITPPRTAMRRRSGESSRRARSKIDLSRPGLQVVDRFLINCPARELAQILGALQLGERARAKAQRRVELAEALDRSVVRIF